MFGNKMDKIAKCIEGGKESGLLKLAVDKDKAVRLAAMAGMGKIGKDESFNLMVTMLTDEDSEIRAAAATALGDMKNEHASAHLRYRLDKETDPAVLTALKGAISNLGGGGEN